MSRLMLLLAFCSIALAAEPSREPLMYDLIINGESFTIEANRTLKLPSKKQPGVTYEVALRVAPVQRLALNRIQLDYDQGYEVIQEPKGGQAAATLRHELGYSIVVSDVGGELKDDARVQVLETLVKSMERSFRAAQAEEIVVSPKHERAFTHSRGKGVTIQYQDAQGRARTCLVYVLAGKGFTASAIVQFPDSAHEDVLPLMKQTLDSISAR